MFNKKMVSDLDVKGKKVIVRVDFNVPIKDGKIKKGKPLTDIADDEIPFDIPDSWKWVRLDDVVIKTIKRGKSPKYTEKSNVLVFAQKCIRRQDTLIYHCLCVWMKPY